MKTTSQFAYFFLTIIFISFAIFYYAGCKEETVNVPTQPSKETYIFLTSQIAITQTILESGANYFPDYIVYCANLNNQQIFETSYDCPFCDFNAGVLPYYKYHDNSQILQIYNATNRFSVDSFLTGIFWWGDKHLRANCIAPSSDFADFGELPFVLPNDSLVKILSIQFNGNASLLAHNQKVTLKPGDTYTYFARRETLFTSIWVPTDTVPQNLHLVITDSVVIKNFGLLPKNFVLFEED